MVRISQSLVFATFFLYALAAWPAKAARIIPKALDLQGAPEYAKKMGFPDIVVKRLFAVPRIITEEYDPESKKWEKHQKGSGVLVKSGQTLSAAHIIEESMPKDPRLMAPIDREFICKQFRVYVQFGVARRIRARITAYDEEADLMLLRFNANAIPPIPPVPLAKHDPAPGDRMFIHGTFFGGDDALITDDTATPVEVSYRRFGKYKNGKGRFVFHHSPSHGNSGGWLLNLPGELEGITIMMDEDWGSAVSREEVVVFLKKADGKKPYCSGE